MFELDEHDWGRVLLYSGSSFSARMDGGRLCLFLVIFFHTVPFPSYRLMGGGVESWQVCEKHISEGRFPKLGLSRLIEDAMLSLYIIGASPSVRASHII